MNTTLANFTDVLFDEITNSQPLSLSSSVESRPSLSSKGVSEARMIERPRKGTGQRGQFRSTEEIDPKYRDVFTYPYFNLVQSSVIEDALYSDKSIVVCAPTGSGKTVVFEMAIVQLLMEIEEKQYTEDFKIIYMAPVKALCTERLTEWYSKFTRLGLMCIAVTGDTDVDFTQLKPYKIIITTPEKWDMLTRRWRDHRGLVEVIKLFLIDEVHILNDETRGPVLEAVVSRMKTIENSAQSVHRIEQLQKEMQGQEVSNKSAPRIRFVAVSATVSNPEDVANWLGTSDKPAVFYKFGDECRPVKLKRIVEGYPCSEGTSIFKFDIILNYKLWPVIQKYHNGKPTLIFCNTRKSVILTAETLSRELTISFNAEQKVKLTAIAASIKNKKLQALVMSGVGCHHAGLLYEERQSIESAFRNRDLPILITTTTLAMGVNLPAHLVIVKNTQQYVNGAYQEYSISTVLQMVGRAGRPQFDTEATAVIMTRLVDKPRYQALVGGCEPLQSYLHKRLPENLNSEAALGTVGDVAQCVQWLRSTFLYVRAARDPKKYLGLPQNSPQHLISKKIEELCVKAMNGLATSGLITMDEASCIQSTEAGRLMSIFYLDLETMRLIMKIEGSESLERLLVLICESHELADMHLRVDERRCLNTLNRNNAAATIRFPMKGKISTRQMKLNCIIQAVLGCLVIPDPSLNQEAMKIMRIADRVCKCLVTYVTRPDLISQQPQFFSAVLNSILLAKCVTAHLWENSPFVSKQLKGIGPTFSTLLASAGKSNFMLLEESHPRDLERIMNKGAPAGNVLRKQVSLLPKYQITMIPVDEKTVTIQLTLLNQSHLSENIENLTAGENHKGYIIVGDSNNNLLLLVAFKDKDLISVFDGTITHTVRRKHNFEHKIYAHCVSSSFVGIDVQAEYLFNDLEPFLGGPCTHTLTNATPNKKVAERQTCITDTFKERKRKNPDAIEKSKEKRKRESAIIENFKYLKQSFETASKNINQSSHQKDEEISNKKTNECSSPKNHISNRPYALSPNPIKGQLNADQTTMIEDMDSDEFIDEDKIDSILNDIENEMSKGKTSLDTAKASLNRNEYFRERNLNIQNPFSTKITTNILRNMSNQNLTTKNSSSKTLSAPRKRKPTITVSNYSFIELLERNLSLSDDEDKTENPQKDNGFSETIKSQIQKYLTKTETKTALPDRNINMLLDSPDDESPRDDKTQTVKDVECERANHTINNPCPRYEIKEILFGKDLVKQNNCKKQAIDNENSICKDSKNIINEGNLVNPYNFNEFTGDVSSNDSTIKSSIPMHNESKVNDQKLSKVKPLRSAQTIVIDNKNFESTPNKCLEVKENSAKKIRCDDISTNKNTAKEIDYSNENCIDIICKKGNAFIDRGETLNGEKKQSDTRYVANIKCGENNLIEENSVIDVDNWNETHLDDTILIEDYYCKKDSNVDSCREKITILESDATMISPKENIAEVNNADINDQRTNITENNVTESFATEGSNNHLNDDILNNKVLHNISNSTKIEVKTKQHPYLDKNPLFGNYTALHNNTSAIENSDSNTQCNLENRNKIICSSMFNHLNPSTEQMIANQKFIKTSPEDFEHDKQKKEYVQRYTYSASKIDVNTKQNSEYSVQLIKRIKMDLDITAIVSRKPNSDKDLKSDYGDYFKQNKRRKIVEPLQHDNTFKNTTQQSNTIIARVNNDIRNVTKVIIPPTNLVRTELPIDRNKLELQSKIIIEDKNKSNNKHIANKSEEDKIDCNDREVQILEIPQEKLDKQANLNPYYVTTDEELKVESSKNCPGNEDNKIRSILQKYSKIITNNTAKPAIPSGLGINRTVTYNTTPNIKSKTPFKITDIHKLHATLPTTITHQKPEVEIIEHVEANKDKEINSNQYTDCTESRRIEEFPEYEPVIDLDLEPIHLPDNVDLEPPKDYNIDNSMFDPKALLQCVADDNSDVIVPPPPEFCDGNDFSPGNENAEISMVNERPKTPQLYKEDNMDYNESIFDDPCATSLTPSTEIETWNLSQEDTWEPFNTSNLSPAQSFTVMRKNTSNDYNLIQNSAMSRQVKLGKFRFNQKNKFKVKK